MEPSTQDLRLVEPPSPEGLMPTALGWEAWCAIGGGLLVLLLIVLWLWQRLRRAKAPSAQDVRERAHHQALAALATCPAEDRTATATQCSIILRRYLTELVGDPALFETHEEWVGRHDSLQSLNSSLREQISGFFSQLAQWKYAPADHADEAQSMIEQSRQLLETIHWEARP